MDPGAFADGAPDMAQLLERSQARPASHAAVPDFISGSCRWQATDRAPDASISRGSTSEQTGIANGHRGWKWQPLGRSMAFGISPARAGLMVLRRVVRRGAARTRACV